jgi:hypothetical protein
MVYFNQILYTIRLDPITKDNDLRLNILKNLEFILLGRWNHKVIVCI